MRNNYPKEWGFICKPSEMIGKTITDASIERMEYGSSLDSCILLRFDDGSRGFLLGRSGDVMIGPDLSVYEKSRFFTPEEYGIVVADDKRREERRRQEQRRRDEEELRRIQERLNKKG